MVNVELAPASGAHPVYNPSASRDPALLSSRAKPNSNGKNKSNQVKNSASDVIGKKIKNVKPGTTRNPQTQFTLVFLN